jgi:hypothetical protein
LGRQKPQDRDALDKTTMSRHKLLQLNNLLLLTNCQLNSI